MDENHETQTIREYINSIALKEHVNVIYGKNQFNVNSAPNSSDEFNSYSRFFGEVLKEFNDYIEKIDFFYHEKDQKLPLSRWNSFFKLMGVKVNPEIKKGEVKKDSVIPEVVSFNEDLVRIITQEDEWGRLNSLAKISDSFNAPSVMAPKNLCYQVFIPLGHIEGITFKLQEFLDAPYKKK